MGNRHFDRRTVAGNAASDADQKGIERTPIEVHEVGKTPVDDRVAQIEIGDAVRPNGVALRIRLECDEREDDHPRRDPNANRGVDREAGCYGLIIIPLRLFVGCSDFLYM